MAAIQLEFNIDDFSDEDLKLSIMQKQIDSMSESMGKVRRRLFSEMSEMKKCLFEIQKENEALKALIKEMKNEKTEWIYSQEDYLFDVRQYKEA